MATDDSKCLLLQHELDVSTQLSNLEKKAGQLEKDFSEMLFAAREMERAVKRYVKRAEAEQRAWEVLEKITEADVNLCDIIDHVKIFFNFVLAKMKVRSADVTDVKMLWHMIGCEGVSQCFSDVIIQCGFTRNDIEDMKILVSVIAKMQEDLEGQGQSGTEENIDKLISHTEKLLELKNGAEIHSEIRSSIESDKDGELGDVLLTAPRKGINETPELNDAFVDDSEDATVISLDADKSLADRGEVNQDVKNDRTEDKDETLAEETSNNDGTGDDIAVVTLKDVAKSQTRPIRDALKLIKFLDVGDDMQALIRNIVCYVTKVRHE